MEVTLARLGDLALSDADVHAFASALQGMVAAGMVVGGSLRLDTYPNPAKYIKKNP